MEVINLEDYIAGGNEVNRFENLLVNGGGGRRRIVADQRAALLHCLLYLFYLKIFFKFKAGISEDSDYTSEISFQPGAQQQQQHQANASAHQYESHLRRPLNQQNYSSNRYI